MSSEMWWYVIRASGLAAWAFASVSVLAGLGMSTGLVAVKRARGLHAWLGGLSVVAIGLHLASLVADSYMSFSLKDVLVPFASGWRPGAVAWGVGALYLLLAVEATSLMRKWLPTKAWRTVHLASFFGFWAATMHAVTAGTDLGVPAIAGIVVATVAAVLGLLLLRIGQSVVPGARARLARRRKAALDRVASAA
jgi:methionine sulfoxide reductase heme-binding subunit